MATLVFGKNNLVALICTTKFKILDYSDGSCKFSFDLTNIKTKTDDKTTKQNDPALGHGNIGCFSPSGQYFGLCKSNKTVTLWQTDTWKLLSTRSLEKKATAILFVKEDNYMVIADKTGDVYKFSTFDVHSKGCFLLGHISMIMAMGFSKDEKFIITAERDEKIRVAHFPNTYNIEACCLGHTDFVSSIGFLSSNEKEVLVSGSGDGCVMFWDFKSGQRIHTECLNEQKEQNREEDQDEQDDKVVITVTCCQKNNVVCVMTEKSCILHFYHVIWDNNLSVTKIPSITSNAPPWSVTYDVNGFLWCLQPRQTNPLIVFRSEGTGPHSQYIRVEQFQDLPAYAALRDWNYLEECVGKEMHLSALRRNKDVDNMKDYLTKKEERIQQKKARQAGLDVAPGRDVKRIKQQ